MKPGTSAVVIMASKITEDKFAEAMKSYGGTLLKTSLTTEGRRNSPTSSQASSYFDRTVFTVTTPNRANPPIRTRGRLSQGLAHRLCVRGPEDAGAVQVHASLQGRDLHLAEHRESLNRHVRGFQGGFGEVDAHRSEDRHHRRGLRQCPRTLALDLAEHGDQRSA